MAQRLARGAAGVDGVDVVYAVEANGVFASLPSEATLALQQDYPFYVWDDETGVVRWMASFDTTEDDVDRFVERLAEVMGAETA
jgi:threonine aldolase